MPFKYRKQVLEELARHGIIPTDETPPDLAQQFVNDLYLYEIRAMRRQMRAGLIPKTEYAGRIEELKKRYPVLGLPVHFWIELE
jgi:hypothetical protein